MKSIFIALLYFPLSLYNSAINILIKNHSIIRVIIMHDIPRASLENFKKKIRFLSKNWNFITPEEFADHLTKSKRLEGRNILLTFDDGYYSNRVVAEEVLNPLGIKAIFFIITDFLKRKDSKEQIKFIKNNLFPDWRHHKFSGNFSDTKPMGEKDLKYLINEGHTIGCHTFSHADLSSITDEDKLKKEIIESADQLEKIISKKIDHFSFSYGNVNFFSKQALSISKSRFKFIHTGMRGNNSINIKPWAIRRDAISLDNSQLEMASFLEGSADFKYKKDFIKYESWEE